MKKVILILLLFSGAVYAQEDSTNTQSEPDFQYNVFKERVYFWQLEKNWKVSPLEIMSLVPTLGIDLETTLKDRLSFQYGIGYVPSFFQPSVGDNEGQFNRMNGYKLRFEGRFYPFKKTSRYISSELSFRHLIINDEVSVGHDGDGNGNFAYFTTENVNAHRFSTQLNLKMGIQKVYASRFVLDFYWGVSMRRNDVVGNLPENSGIQGNFNNRFGWNLSNGHSLNYVTPIVGLKLGFHTPAKKNL